MPVVVLIAGGGILLLDAITGLMCTWRGSGGYSYIDSMVSACS
ncbi:hypothetical protein ACFQ0X_04340 [Streptomyces rectiviolaceus]